MSTLPSPSNAQSTPETTQESTTVIPEQTFEDWFVTCEGNAQCRMSQTIVQPSTQRLILQMKVFAGEQPTLLISFPLGILLSTGWQFQIDSGKRNVLPFEICNTEGCHAGVPLSPQLLKSMKRGNKMKITFFDAAKEKVEPEISLIGFTKAWETLQ